MKNGAEGQTIRTAEAGHWGKEVRSDAHVWIEPRDRAGIDVVLESRVKAYYGDSIRKQAEEALNELGVKHAQVLIHDEGALPFVIAARIEAAVHRAGLGEGKRVLPDDRAFTCREASRNISSMLPCMVLTPSFLISKTLSIPARKMQRGSWCGIRCGWWIF